MMLNKNAIFILIVILVSMFALSTVSAADNSTSNVTAFVDDVTDENIIVQEISTSFDEKLSSSPKTFTDLNNLINDNSNFDIYLDNDYKFSKDSDYQFIGGIPITRSINIRGNGFTIDGNNQARIFNASSYVNFYDIIFINANSDCGSAIYGSSYAAFGCEFTNNYATRDGGAMYNGYAENCLFTANSAGSSGGAMYSGSVNNCNFVANSAPDGGAIFNVYATNSVFINNTASRSCGAMYGSSAGNCTFRGNSARDHSGALGFGYALNCLFISNSAYQSGALGGAGSAEGCTFKYNRADEGGAIFGCTAYKCTFIGNSANQGGAMAGTCSASYCVFTENSAINYGGALSGVYAVNCNFTGNHAIYGGAMYLNSASQCNFISNSAVNGGAMYNSHAVSCNFDSNSATLGGAICDGSASSSSFKNNYAVNGGAVAGGSAEGSVLACTFLSNTAENYGGAIYATSAIRCYFKSNTAKYGGAISSGSSASESVFINNIAKVSGGARYDSYVGNSNFSGNLPVYTFYASDFSAIEGFGGNIRIKLSDSPNDEVIGENVTIKVYNSKNILVGTYSAQTGFNWFVDLPAGKYRAILSVDDVAYELDSFKIMITIQKSSFIYVTNVVANYNDGKCLVVNLHDSQGKVIKYAKVSINLNGQTKTYSTDDNGQVIVSTKGLIPKSYVAKINYVGDDTYVKSSASATINVKKVNPKIIASKKTFKVKDKTKKYTVTLKNNKNAIIKNAKVTITAKGKTYSATTNAKGIVTFKLTKLTKKGIFSSVIKFAGNKYYNAIKMTVKITVKK